MAIITTKYTGKMLFAAAEKLPSSREDFKITNTILIIVTKIKLPPLIKYNSSALIAETPLFCS